MQPPPPTPGFFQNLGQHFQQTVARQARYGYGNLGGAARGALMAAAPEVGIPLEITRAAMNTAKEAVKGLHDFVEQTLAANRALAPFSAKLQQSYAQLSLNDLRRTMALSKTLEDPAASLVRFTDDMRQALQPFVIASHQAGMTGAAFGAGAVGGLAQSFRPIADLVTGLKDLADPEGGLANSVGMAVASGFASFTPFLGQLLAAIELINKTLGFGEAGEAVGAGGPWESMILHEAGPMRSDPIRPARQVNLGRRD
jgi:hypothetical protein